MKFVIGLGNPGEQYARTRHNVGWLVLDRLARVWHIEREHVRWEGLVASKRAVKLFKPLTSMNESGRAVALLVGAADVGLDEVLVVLDDLNLSLGTVRLRADGSAGGHHGLESVIETLGTDRFPRLRLGIGPRQPDLPGKDFVLSSFDEGELPLVKQLVERAALAAQCWVKDGLEAAMSRYNGPVEP